MVTEANTFESLKATKSLNWHKWSAAYTAVAVCVVSIAITTLFRTVLPNRYVADQRTDYRTFYSPVAQNILNGRGIVLHDEPATTFPPGYPLLLAGIFTASHWLNIPAYVGASAANVIGMALVSLFIFLLARLLFGPLAALISSAAWMTYPFALWLTKQPNSEIPFMVVLYGGLYLFFYLLLRKTGSWPLFFICGLIFGFAMLIRPIAIGLGFALAGVIWLLAREMTARFRTLLISMLLLGSLVAVLPWEMWVYAKTGEIISVSSSGAQNMREGVIFAVNGSDYRPQRGVSPDIERVMNDILKRPSELISVRGIVSVVAAEFHVHPIAVAKLYLLKAARSWYGTDSRQQESLILLVQLGYLLPLLWCARRLWRPNEMSRKIVVSILLLVIYFWGMTILVNSTLRYMLPVTGILFLLIGAGIARPGSRTSKQVFAEANPAMDASNAASA